MVSKKRKAKEEEEEEEEEESVLKEEVIILQRRNINKRTIQYLVDKNGVKIWTDKKNIPKEKIEEFEEIVDDEALVKRINSEITNYDTAKRVTQERVDPLLVINWNSVGILQRAVAVPAANVADPATTPLSIATVANLSVIYPAGRPVFDQALMEQILTTTDAGVAIGVLKSNGLPGITMIKYESVPDWTNQVNRLLRVCPVLRRDYYGTFPNTCGNVFRVYCFKTTGRPINYDVETTKESVYLSL